MKTSSITLHQNLIRLAKGALKAYEQWLEDQCIEQESERLKKDKRERVDNHIETR